MKVKLIFAIIYLEKNLNNLGILWYYRTFRNELPSKITTGDYNTVYIVLKDALCSPILKNNKIDIFE